MTVATNFRTEVRPYSGYADPALPIGSWIAAGDRLGDASGGFVQMNFLFQFGAQPLNSQMYNVEQFTAEISQSVTQRANLETRNMDRLSPDRTVGVQRWDFVLSADGIDNTMIDLASQAGLPIWLGAPTVAGLECGLRVQFVNTDTLTYTVRAQGYIWGPRSVLAPGGPQRPLGGFFGR